MIYQSIGENTQIDIGAFRRYARLADDIFDDDIRQVVQSACIRVQEYADRAILPCTVTIVGEGDAVRLYQFPVASIDSVEDLDTGVDEKDACRVEGKMLVLPYAGRFRVRYTTDPSPSEVERLRAYVWEMAAAIWDGNTEEEQKVYQRIPADYVV